MVYKDVFAFRDKKDQSEFSLIDYSYLIDKYKDDNLRLDENFNLKYFLSKFILDVDILSTKDFLEHHYDYCDDPEEYYKVLELKVVPTVENVIEECQPYQMGMSYYKEIPLEDDFVNTEGVIKKRTFENNYFKHFTSATNKKHELQKKLELLKSFVEEYKDPSPVTSLKWLAGPSELGVIIEELITKGYLDGPKSRGEINNRRLAKELIKIFNCNENVALTSLQVYVNPNNKKNKQAKENFHFTLFPYNKKDGLD
ncbi:hypothetical protein [Winogradskyella tangerina]|uniref:hypothetical protein n=1 Tax=Winogradskyella tangerina TaxID=2023240 RepID=UPI000DBE55AE|nr:hypothetical protein [Winogradskyella tangerina]